MSDQSQWVWGTLTPAHLAHAEAVTDRLLENVRQMGLQQTGHSHTPDERYQKLLGMESEIAFRVITGRPIPSVEDMASTWSGPDVDGMGVKGVSRPGYHLLFQDKDALTIRAFVLMLNAKPRFAIMGWIDVPRALQVRTWGAHLPTPAWKVEQKWLHHWPAVLV